jgi:hypothetical protein
MMAEQKQLPDIITIIQNFKRILSFQIAPFHAKKELLLLSILERSKQTCPFLHPLCTYSFYSKM